MAKIIVKDTEINIAKITNMKLYCKHLLLE